MMNSTKACNVFASRLFGYNTGKVLHIKNNKVGFLNRAIQLAIIGYVLFYVIIYKKGYQSVDVGLSSVVTKVKGTAFTNLSIQFPIKIGNESKPNILFDGPRNWDSSDYVIPHQENDVVFIMTNMIITPRQQQGTCPELDEYEDAKCQNDTHCVANKPIDNGHGVMTGRCVKPDRPPFVNDAEKPNVCEIYAWCPVEYDQLPMPGTNFGHRLNSSEYLLKEAIDFTILVKNSVLFPAFGVRVRNINDHENETYLRQCTYGKIGTNGIKDRLCPIFKLQNIFDEIHDTTFSDAAIKGGVVGINIKWDCDFDFGVRNCQPYYSFLGIKDPIDDPNVQIAKGYNFRFARFDVENNTQYRTLIKAYGIRFVILVDAKARKFDIVPLLRNLGAGLALLSLATIICDFCVVNLSKKKRFYREKIYEYVDGSEPNTNEMRVDSHNDPFLYRALSTVLC
ncbi:P2X purinoceptor 4-like [Xenia sp. Carnegie-2017]|uniref:P2X purinoceptor 4-like n=1 Tax=Xenia sp. Carnegie-2017 TaxID=2897299 RepID=UPI001F04F16D|nr:P2X purinoceptor 4-like [Xenia sp. Carnegie-2017]